MYKMIALDLDGTTLNSQGQITQATENALNRASQSDIHTVIASGRPFCALPESAARLKCFEYAITSNGSSIFNIHTKKRILAKDMHPSAVRSALKIMDASGYNYEIFCNGIGYVSDTFYQDPTLFGLSLSSSDYIRRTRRPVEDSLQFALSHLEEIEGLNLIVPHADRRLLLIHELKQIPDIYLTASHSSYIELSDASVNKALSLNRLALQLGVRREEIIAFGDADNDLELLQYAGTGVAMGNGTDKLKAAADTVTLSNDKDGVAYYLNKYVLD